MTDETTEAPKRAPRAAKVEPEPTFNITQAIAKVREEAGALAPASKNGVPFAFRGIDGTVAHLVPFLNKYGIITVPNVVYCNVSERQDEKGRTLKTSDVLVAYDFIAPDGSKVSATTPGLADDYADRSTAQAMSVAFRIALLQTFTLPTHSPEPEETGQAVLDQRSAPRSANAVEKARASAAGGEDKLPGLQTKAKVLGGRLKKTAKDLNDLGTKLSEGTEVTDWYNSEVIMAKLVDALEAEATA
jgi:hypothetical protein